LKTSETVTKVNTA